VVRVISNERVEKLLINTGIGNVLEEKNEKYTEAVRKIIESVNKFDLEKIDNSWLRDNLERKRERISSLVRESLRKPWVFFNQGAVSELKGHLYYLEDKGGNLDEDDQKILDEAKKTIFEFWQLWDKVEEIGLDKTLSPHQGDQKIIELFRVKKDTK